MEKKMVKVSANQTWWCMPIIIPALERLRKDGEFEAGWATQ
jgi:hypothetical protein